MPLFAVLSIKGVEPLSIAVRVLIFAERDKSTSLQSYFYGLSFDMPTDGVLHSAHQFRRFGYHLRVILRDFAVIAYALAHVCSSLLTPVIAHWSRGRGLFRKVHPLAGQVRLVGCQCTMGAFQTPGREADSGCLPKGWTELGGSLLATKDRRGIQWTFGPVSAPPDNNIFLNNIKIRRPLADSITGIYDFPHLTLQNF